MSKPSIAEVALQLVDNQRTYEAKALTAELENRAAAALCWRALKAESDKLYAWITENESLTVAALMQGRELAKSIAKTDEQLLDYRITQAMERVAA